MLEESLFLKEIFIFFILISFSIFLSSAFAVTLTVCPSGCDSTTIQGAIDLASPGDAISVAAGTYDEQVVVDKNMTIQGSGDTTIIRPSSDAKLTTILDGNHWGGGTKQIAGIIVANVPPVSNVILKNLKVDGSGVNNKPAGADYVAGIFYRETSGTIDSVTVTDITVGTTGTAVRGYGVFLSAISNTELVEIKDSTITNYDKNGIEVSGDKLTVNIHDNTVTGRGPLPSGDEVQNGILIGNGATGTFNDNIISSMAYVPETWWSAGIMFYEADGSADDNTITNCQIGIIYQDGSGTAKYNIINGGAVGLIGLWTQYTKGGIWTASFMDNTVSGISDSSGIGMDGGAIGVQSWNAGASITVIIDNNQLTGGSTSADGIYIGDIPAYNPAGTITATIIDNIISGWNHGIHLVSPVAYADISGNTIKNNLGSDSGIHVEAAIDATKLHVNFNNIIGNLDYGIFNGGSGVLNATYNWWGTNTGPYHPSNSGGTGDKVSDNVLFNPWLTLDLTLSSPINKIYDINSILINVSTSLKVDKIEYSDNDNILRRLCSRCDSYSRKKSFSEGNHVFTVKATLGDEGASKTVNFFVDSIKPRIIKTLPEDGDIIHGTTFYIKYTEANLMNVSLYWKESIQSTYQQKTNYTCESGTNKECTLNVDLSSYDGKMINFYFDVQDPTHIVKSDVRTITIDDTNPVVTINSPEDKKYSSRRIDLDVAVDEQVERLEYSLDEGRFIRLCSNCRSYKRMNNFNDGYHTLVVRATDYAGNTGQSSIHFFVDSKPPRIIKQYPQDKKYTNGTFVITYTEEYLNKITLYYKGVMEPGYKSSFKDTCESGKSKECVFYVDLTSYDDQLINYYFVVQDSVSETTGKIYTVNVDTKTPIIEIYSPESKTYESRRVQLNIKVDEPVDLEYSDNGGRFIRLCSRCDSYDRPHTFSYGWHGLQIRATDNAGNTAIKSVEFTIENLF